MSPSDREPTFQELIEAVRTHFEPRWEDLLDQPLPIIDFGAEIDPVVLETPAGSAAELPYTAPASGSEAEVSRGDPIPGCLLDPFSVRGLRRLAADDPQGWRAQLHAHLPEQAHLDVAAGRTGLNPTLRQVLLAFCDRLLPDPASNLGVESVRRARQVLFAVVEHDGDMAAEQVAASLSLIRRNAGHLVRDGGRAPLSSEAVSRAMSLVRAALNYWLASQGKPPLGPPGAVAAAPRRPPQRTVTLRRVWELIKRAEPAERIKIGLAVGAGLREPEIEALRVCDLAAYEATPDEALRLDLLPGIRLVFVRVDTGGEPARTRWTPLPPWLSDLMRAAPLGLRASKDKNRLLVPGELAPSLSAALRRLQKEVSPRQRITPSDLRRTWQGVARRARCSREVVRQTWSHSTDSDRRPLLWHRAQVQLWLLATGWADFSGGVAERFVDHVDRVPRKARPGCGATAPEIAPAKRRRPAPLPSRLRELPPAPATVEARRRLKDAQ